MNMRVKLTFDANLNKDVVVVRFDGRHLNNTDINLLSTFIDEFKSLLKIGEEISGNDFYERVIENFPTYSMRGVINQVIDAGTIKSTFNLDITYVCSVTSNLKTQAVSILCRSDISDAEIQSKLRTIQPELIDYTIHSMYSLYDKSTLTVAFSIAQELAKIS